MTRTATTQEITKTLITLFSVLPPKGMTGSDDDSLIAGYLVALDGVDAKAMKLTAMAVIKGEIETMSVKVCPTPSELSREVRRRMAHERRLELASTVTIDPQPALPRQKSTGFTTALNKEFQAWHNGSPAGPMMREAFSKHYGDHMDATRQRMINQGRRLLYTDKTKDQFEHMAKAREIPTGAYFIGITGEIYSPKTHNEGENHD